MSDSTIPLFKAISDPSRLEIMDHIVLSWLTVNEIVGKMEGKINQPTVSYHLRLLEEANLVAVKRKGRQRFYVLNRAEIAKQYNGFVNKFSPKSPLAAEEIPLPPFGLRIQSYTDMRKYRRALRLHLPRARKILDQR